ncbi:hypothetical protein HB943_14640 [Listeria weihenstephanensis]|uniref:Uncharacterized protein n=1 Tax=Listeria weihenstephanensis TaxID=1006155 RepID=A0A841ZBE2_9LIST|nr:hypothetical protein [Listeria weihenstephanensis]MBC1501836.1 hypothetical protein [Listeria weihenstephanensis]
MLPITKENFIPQFNNEKDEMKLDKIMNIIEPFDKLEFLSRIAALRLYFQNRDKPVLLDVITTATINWLSKNEWNHSGTGMSYGKFKKIIQDLNNLEIRRNIDPAENPYVERILCFDNYNIIPGINYTPTFNLQAIIDTLFLSENELSQYELMEYAKLLQENLMLSSIIIETIDEYKIEIEVDFTRDIFIPSQQSLAQKAETLIVSTAISQNEKLMIDTKEDIKYEIDPFTQDDHIFLKKPYIMLGEKILVLDISSIASALAKYVIDDLKIAEKNETLDSINNNIWRKSHRYLGTLGHEKLKEKDLGIELIDDANYKESLLNVANDKFLIVVASLESWSKKTSNHERMNSRIKIIVKKLSENGIAKENIFLLVIPHSFSGEQPIALDLLGIPYVCCLSPNEIKAISINETQEMFIPRFMRAKKRMRNAFMSTTYGDFNLLCAYTANNYSFYANDDFDYQEVDTFFPLDETGIYIDRANQKEPEKIFHSSIDRTVHNTKRDNNLGVFIGNLVDESISYFIGDFHGYHIELKTKEIDSLDKFNIFTNLLDCFSYWMKQYFSKVELTKNINIVLELSDATSKYSRLESEEKLEYRQCAFSRKSNTIVMSVSSLTYLSFGNTQVNFYEKKSVVDIIQNAMNQCNSEVIEEIFSPKHKKKITGKVMNTNIEYTPTSVNIKRLSINESDTNLTLDDLGYELKKQGYKVGAIPIEDNSDICNKIVGYLYNVLQTRISKYNKVQLFKALYQQLEVTLYTQLWQSSNYNQDILLIPERKDIALTNINNMAMDSLALKFLMEYCAATPSSGSDNIGMWELEELMGVCSQILSWAHRSDLFKYGLVETKISMLPSNRIGLKHEDFDKYNLATYNGKLNQLSFDGNGSLTDEALEKKKEEFFDMFNENFNDLFTEEFGYSFEVFNMVVDSLIIIGSDSKRTVICLPLDDVAIEVKKIVVDKASKEEIEKVIYDFGLCERSNFLEPPEGFSKKDVLPWRFNRNLSFIRRPIVIHDGNVIWGIRNLAYLKKYLYHLIFDGTYKAQSKSMKVLMSNIANYLGDKFNSEVQILIRSYPDLQVYKGVAKFGKKKITDENKNVLGDIDILAFNTKTKKIFVVETKDFNLARNPYEIEMEIKKIFKGEKSFLVKHQKREKWVVENLDTILEHYELPQGKWKIKSMFIVSEHIISRDLKKNNTQFLGIKELTAKTFR